ncbi:hypothetical protein GCM10010912_17530 [Paenibacillus albidus]|uniref:Uncharacterized protein n=1 Tax=Paenibacillus albidus TaxID=2041023 RepID=A0A917FDE0_9BACL|nr:hypothetical protein [Paenibacillus albidus]GGF72805.1 hypothetical protein GCM10010912_17530 [Paenibacillus albidus]
MYKHYIRVDANGNVIRAFSDAFEQSQDGDILVSEGGGRHFNLDLWYNGVIPRWHVPGDQMVERDAKELTTLWTQYQAAHPPELSDIEQLRIENMELKLALTELAEAQEVDKTEVQLALAEIAILIGGE